MYSSSDISSRKQPGPPPSTASCYICFEDGADSEEQPLLRNCACRGEAGWAHVACLAKFADSKMGYHNQEYSDNLGPIWQNCILCKTPYVQNMGLAMAEACVKRYEDLPDNDMVRMFSLNYMATMYFDIGNNDAALKTFNHLLDILKIARGLGQDVRGVEAKVLSGVISVYTHENRFVEAIAVNERIIELTIDLEGPNSLKVQDKKEMLAMLHSFIGEGSDHKCHGSNRDTAADLVWARQRFKESQKDGDTMESRLQAHKGVVNALKDDGKIEEATEELESLLSKSRQVLGPDHPVTLQYENAAKDFYTTLKQEARRAEIFDKDVWAVIDYEKKPAIHGQRVKVLKATKKDAGTYICEITNHNGVSTKVKVGHDQFTLERDTKVVIHGLVSSTDLNGNLGVIYSFDKKKRRYAVLMVGKGCTVLIKPINLDIYFSNGNESI